MKIANPIAKLIIAVRPRFNNICNNQIAIKKLSFIFEKVTFLYTILLPNKMDKQMEIFTISSLNACLNSTNDAPPAIVKRPFPKQMAETIKR